MGQPIQDFSLVLIDSQLVDGRIGSLGISWDACKLARTSWVRKTKNIFSPSLKWEIATNKLCQCFNVTNHPTWWACYHKADAVSSDKRGSRKSPLIICSSALKIKQYNHEGILQQWKPLQGKDEGHRTPISEVCSAPRCSCIIWLTGQRGISPFRTGFLPLQNRQSKSLSSKITSNHPWGSEIIIGHFLGVLNYALNC